MGRTAINRALLRDAMAADRLPRLWLEGGRVQEGLDRMPAAGRDQWAVSPEIPLLPLVAHGGSGGAPSSTAAPLRAWREGTKSAALPASERASLTNPLQET